MNMYTNSYCNYCSECNYCDYCSFCTYCKDCGYCRGLKMTEYNYFCWATNSQADTGFQQKRYRVFNVEVSSEEYFKINKLFHRIEFDESEIYETRFSTAFKKMWNNLSEEKQQEFLDIPHFNWEGFTYITGVTQNMVKSNNLTGKEVEVKIDGATYTAFIK